MGHITDAEKWIKPPHAREAFRYWLEFRLDLKTRAPTFRRWFDSLEARKAYILDLARAANTTITDHGEEMDPL